jgi:class 3 adenylate cyclase
MEEMAEQVAGANIYGPPAGIPDVADLFAHRRAVIESALSGAEHPEEISSPSSDLLAEKVGQKQEVAVLSVDVIDSTRLQVRDPEAYGRINQILLREIAAVTSVFGGAVINFTGDGAVVGFLGPGFNVANDMVFDSATTLVADIYGVMNPALEAAGLFAIDVRVGLDMNQAEVAVVGSEDSRRQHDVLGLAVSMAAKVQARSGWARRFTKPSTSAARSCLSPPHLGRGGTSLTAWASPTRCTAAAWFPRPLATTVDLLP